MDLLFRGLSVSPAGGCSGQGMSSCQAMSTGNRSAPSDPAAATTAAMGENLGEGLAFWSLLWIFLQRMCNANITVYRHIWWHCFMGGGAVSFLYGFEMILNWKVITMWGGKCIILLHNPVEMLYERIVLGFWALWHSLIKAIFSCDVLLSKDIFVASNKCIISLFNTIWDEIRWTRCTFFFSFSPKKPWRSPTCWSLLLISGCSVSFQSKSYLSLGQRRQKSATLVDFKYSEMCICRVPLMFYLTRPCTRRWCPEAWQISWVLYFFFFNVMYKKRKNTTT